MNSMRVCAEHPVQEISGLNDFRYRKGIYSAAFYQSRTCCVELKDIIPFEAITNLSMFPMRQSGFRHRHICSHILVGEGLEIGALHNPFGVPATCKVNYLDLMRKDTLIKLFPEVTGQDIVEPDYIGNIANNSVVELTNRRFDFIIANHVIEHVANPIKTIENIWAGLQDGGYLILSIPDKNYTFDKDRSLTSYEHLLAEYYLDVHEVSNDHYIEALQYIHPQVFDNRLSLLTALNNFRLRSEHAHVWDSCSFKEHLNRIIQEHQLNALILIESTGEWNHFEYFAVIKKTELKDDVDGGMRILSALYEDRRDLRKAFPDFSRGNPRSLLEWALNADKFGDCDAHLLKGLKNSFERRLNLI